MNQYAYNGPVMEFDRCIANNYKATTRAVSLQERMWKGSFLQDFFGREETQACKLGGIFLDGKG